MFGQRLGCMFDWVNIETKKQAVYIALKVQSLNLSTGLANKKKIHDHY
jgi:hypothetical protein